MRRTILVTSVIAAVAAALSVQAAAPATPQGFITFYTYPGDARTVVTANATITPDGVFYPKRAEGPYPGYPGEDLGVPEDAPANARDAYTMHLKGYFYPPKTGRIQLAISGDDASALFFSTDDSPANKRQVANEPVWNGIRAFGAEARRSVVNDGQDPDGRIENRSPFIQVTAGRPYFIEAYAVEGGGGDNLAVAFRYDDEPEFLDQPYLPIPGSMLSSFDRVDPGKVFTGAAGITPTSANVALMDGAGAAPAKAVAASVTAKLNGNTVTVTSARNATDSGLVVTYTQPADTYFASGTTQNLLLSFTDDKGGTYTVSSDLVTPAYATLNAANRVTGNTAQRGFIWRVHQNGAAGEANDNGRTERQLNGEILVDGVPIVNLADPSAQGAADGPATAPNPDWAPIQFNVSGVINFDQAEGSSNGNFTPDLAMPGIPGVEGGNNSIAAEVLTYVELPKGLTVLGVNSDDGFLAQTGVTPKDPFAVNVGEFSGGRGAANTDFNVVVPEAGVYPMRFTWEEGGGGANIEIYSVKADGTRVLLNDTDNGGLRTFRATSTPAPVLVTRLAPARDGRRVALDANIVVDVTDGGSTLNASSVTMKVDGAAATVTTAKAGAVTTITHNPATNFKPDQRVAVELAYADATGKSITVNYVFYARTPEPTELATPAFWIEAEDFNHGGGQTIAAASTMPYLGGAYDGLAATEGIDYNNNDANDSDVYRTELDGNGENEVNINDNLGGRWGAQRPGGATMTANYKIGWVEYGSWQNYTRTIPQGSYKVYAALSYDGFGLNQLGANLHKVTAGANTANQTVEPLGTFRGYGSGGWGPNDLVVLKNAAGQEAVLQLGGVTTLRVEIGSGDFDYIVLTPAAATPTEIKFDSIVLTGGQVVITWSGGGTLQAADSVNGPYTDVAGATSPRTIAPAGAGKFYRVRQ